MSHTPITCTCKNRLGCSLLPFTLMPQYLKRFNKIKNTLKQTKFEEKTVKSTQLSLVLVGLYDFQIFPDRTAHAWSLGVGNMCSVLVLFVRVGSQIPPRQAKKDSNIPSPGRTRSVKRPTRGSTKTIKSPPHALPPPTPRRHNIDRCINHLMHEIMEFRVTLFLALDNWEPKYCQTLGNEPNHLHRVLWGRLFSKRKIKLFNSLFHSVFLVFRKSLFSIADLFPMSYLWFVCNDDKCCVVTTWGRFSCRLACLRLHVLRAYSNFESKQAKSISLFGRRPNKYKGLLRLFKSRVR